MYFHKSPYRSNFEYVSDLAMKSGKGSCSVTDFRPEQAQARQRMAVVVQLTRHEGDVYYLQMSSPRWPQNKSQSELELPPTTESGDTSLTLGNDGGLRLYNGAGEVLIDGIPGMGFGVCGQASCFNLRCHDEHQFYGMGEKMLGLELSGKRTKFWNTDVWADFDRSVFWEGNPDPGYVSVPYLIIKRDNRYLGILVDNPYAVFMQTKATISIAGQQEAQEQPEQAITLGAEHGQPNLVIIHGPSLAELTRKLQSVVGRSFLPPVWALGYQQCRWGYASKTDLEYVSKGLDRYEIPCDGLWLDIEYMRGYRVFTWNEQLWPSVEQDLDDLQAGGRYVIPIIDPGVKCEAGYTVYESGHEADAYCLNPQGQEFIGLVWPGETVFPDFSLPTARDWWASQVQSFAEQGIHGAWLDMNDPSTGPAAPFQMRFGHGAESHHSYHNQYATGMARATRAGFEAARPDERTFLLSRSGFTGSSRYCAIWTGDNISNRHYLKTSIPCTLNLALSGIPFNGPDCGGFGGDATPDLMIDWYKAGCLFPFLRNHAIRNSYDQEPWQFGKQALSIVRDYIRLRYSLRPYLYNLFVDQHERGEAILRPLFYDFDDTPELPLGYIDDQFMVGPGIMQAPFLEDGQALRIVRLPRSRWYSLLDAAFIDGGRNISVSNSDETTPLFFRAGSIIPMQHVTGGDHRWDSRRIEAHVVLEEGQASCDYVYDDGISTGHQRGERSCVQITAVAKGDSLNIRTEQAEQGYGDCDLSFICYKTFKTVTVNGRKAEPKSFTRRIAGVEQRLFRC